MDGTSISTVPRDQGHSPSKQLSINCPIRTLKITKCCLRLRTKTPPPQILQMTHQATRTSQYIHMDDVFSSLVLRWYFRKRRISPSSGSPLVKPSELAYPI